MSNSNFSNPTGYINTNNYSTAKDLGRLSSVIVRYYEIVKLTDLEKATIQVEGKNKRSVGISTTNLMLKENRNIKGLKTGFTFASGECLVLYYDFGNDEKLITIVLNASDRFRESRELYNLIVKAFN
jgi:D-alanyl-D-alanine carboxypeptidase